MMENLRGVAALKRSKMLAMRSIRTTAAAVAILFFVPMVFGGMAAFVAAVSVKAFTADSNKASENKGQTAPAAPESESEDAGNADEPKNGFKFRVDGGGPVQLEEEKGTEKSAARVRNLAREILQSVIMLPFQILLISLSSIIVALLYLKTRQAGGESLQDLMAQFEETDRPRKKWQERVRQRLIQSGRITSKT
jgi:hypothetical protein